MDFLSLCDKVSQPNIDGPNQQIQSEHSYNVNMLWKLCNWSILYFSHKNKEAHWRNGQHILSIHFLCFTCQVLCHCLELVHVFFPTNKEAKTSFLSLSSPICDWLCIRKHSTWTSHAFGKMKAFLKGVIFLSLGVVRYCYSRQWKGLDGILKTTFSLLSSLI